MTLAFERWTRIAGVLVATALLTAACGSSNTSSSTTSSSSATSSTAPTGTSQEVGLTTDQVTVANISTLSGPVPGLFQGALFGTQAFAAYINSKGGVSGRKLVVKSGDDGFSCTNNQALTQDDVSQVFAFVGSFSLFDNCGARVIQTIPDLPDVHDALDPAAQAIPNNFSPQPVGVGGWRTGPLMYYKAHYPKAVTSAAALTSNVASAIASFNGYKAAAQALGYHFVYQRLTNPLETDFTADVIRMRNAGVQFLVMFEDIKSIARVLNAAQQQGWHPQVVTSAGQLYDASLFSLVNPGAATGAYNDQTQVMWLGQDRSNTPEVNLFLTWLNKTHPGFQPDIYTVYGWASGRLFAQALQAAGKNPTRASVTTALRNITNFDSNGLLAPGNPAAKTPPTCWMLVRVENNAFVRVTPPNKGVRCDGTFGR